MVPLDITSIKNIHHFTCCVTLSVFLSRKFTPRNTYYRKLTLGSLVDIELTFLIVPSRDLLYFCYCRFESFLDMCSDWISPPILSKVIIISLLGSFSLCFTYASYFLCKILISSVCKIILLESSCLIVAIPFLLYCLLEHC